MYVRRSSTFFKLTKGVISFIEATLGFEPDAIKFIDFLKAKGLKVIYYDLEHIKVQHFLLKTH